MSPPFGTSDSYTLVIAYQDRPPRRRLLDHHEEGIPRAREALKIDEQLNDTAGQVYSLHRPAELLYDDKQLGAAKEVAYRAIDLSPTTVVDSWSYLSLQGRGREAIDWHDPLDCISFQLARPVVLGSLCSSRAISRREDDADVDAPSRTRSTARALWAVVPPPPPPRIDCSS